ncbi:hypothetical protein HHK36_008424 [Tetracentron sinense]|uniref:Patatin n=1 Tax=Tetracentron sinense TaxID=13715 RepID=A0A835DN59_TETSI|nr:hypothetical protein HHK36_008424 [Tetracentron sinense]
MAALSNSTDAKKITLLTIDGGGIRALIPAVILSFLESQLQDLDGEDARIADYFDVIGGTSTGGLVAAMLTMPSGNNRPLYAAKEIVPFFFENYPKIFHPLRGPFTSARMILRDLVQHKYSGKYFHGLMQNKFGGLRISRALTNLVIHTFDIKLLQPVVFSMSEGKIDISKDAMISDICTGTTATPTYLPPHYFETQDSQGSIIRTFNLVDGAALLAMSHVTQEVFKGNSEFYPVKPRNYGKFLVISLGTGTMKKNKKYNADKAAKWGILGWLRRNGKSPIVDTFTQASASMIDFHMHAVLQTLSSEHNYLRIQENELEGHAASLDITTKKNMENLVKIGERLLRKPLDHGETVGQALTRFAKTLSEERKARQQRSTSK